MSASKPTAEEDFLEALKWLREMAGGHRTAHNRQTRRLYAERLVCALEGPPKARRAFCIFDVLAAYKGYLRLVSLDNVLTVLSFLTCEPLVPHQVRHAVEKCTAWFEAEHPFLKTVESPDLDDLEKGHGSPELLLQCRKNIMTQYGPTLVLSPIPQVALELYKRALKELG